MAMAVVARLLAGLPVHVPSVRCTGDLQQSSPLVCVLRSNGVAGWRVAERRLPVRTQGRTVGCELAGNDSRTEGHGYVFDLDGVLASLVSCVLRCCWRGFPQRCDSTIAPSCGASCFPVLLRFFCLCSGAPFLWFRAWLALTPADVLNLMDVHI